MKGIFYSLVAVLLVMPLLMLAASIVDVENSSMSSSASKAMGSKLLAFSKSVEDDLPRAVPIMAKRSIGDAIIYIDNTGNPLADSSQTLRELMTNGTIYGNVTTVDFTMKSWADILADKGDQYGFNTNVDVISIGFYSPDSYVVNVEAVVAVNISIPSAEMNLYRVYNTTTSVSIVGFSDPLYTLKTNGIMKRTIAAPVTAVSGTNSFDNAVGSGLYMRSVQGPGFMDRLEGRTSGSGKYNRSAAGLESVVYLPDLQANGITIDTTKTDMDYLYFDAPYHAGSAVIGSRYSWLKIDAEHAGTYNLSI